MKRLSFTRRECRKVNILHLVKQRECNRLTTFIVLPTSYTKFPFAKITHNWFFRFLYNYIYVGLMWLDVFSNYIFFQLSFYWLLVLFNSIFLHVLHSLVSLRSNNVIGFYNSRPYSSVKYLLLYELAFPTAQSVAL